MKSVCLTFFACLWAAAAHADFAKCLEIVDEAARLDCYDDAHGYHSPKDESAPVADSGAWAVQSELSKIDDSTNVFMTLQSEEETNCRYKTGTHTLMIACRENTTSMWITFAGCFMSSIQGKGRVTYRLDGDPAQTARFRESNDNMALGLWSGGSAIPFLKRLLDHDRLLVRATPFSDSTVTGEYDIKGIDTAIAPLREACNW